MAQWPEDEVYFKKQQGCCYSNQPLDLPKSKCLTKTPRIPKAAHPHFAQCANHRLKPKFIQGRLHIKE